MAGKRSRVKSPTWQPAASVTAIVGGRVRSHAPGREGAVGHVLGDVPLDNMPADSIALVAFGDGPPEQINIRWLEPMAAEEERDYAAEGLIDAPLLHRAAKFAGVIETDDELGLAPEAIKTFLSEAKFTDENEQALPLHGQSMSIGIAIGLAAVKLRDEGDEAPAE